MKQQTRDAIEMYLLVAAGAILIGFTIIGASQLASMTGGF